MVPATHLPSLTHWMASSPWRMCRMMSATTSSATAWLLRPGVHSTGTPAFVQAATSRLAGVARQSPIALSPL